MAASDRHFGEQEPILRVLEGISKGYGARGRQRGALARGALAVCLMELYRGHLRSKPPQGGPGRGIWESGIFRRSPGSRGVERKRMAMARQKIEGDVVALARISANYEIGSDEMRALAMAAFALMRVSSDDAPLRGYRRHLASLGKPLTTRQRKRLKALGINA